MDINWIVDAPASPLPTGDLGHGAISLDGKQTWTFDELRIHRNRYCHALSERGIKAGDRVGLLMVNSLEYLALYFAIARLGAIAVRLNFRLSAPELEYILRDSGCSVVCLHADRVDRVDPIREASPVARWIVFPHGEAGDTPYWAEPSHGLEEASDDDVAFERPAGTDPLMLMYTSGTTGRPKGAIWTHANALWLGSIQAMKWSYTRHTVAMTMGPLYHAGAFEDVLLPAMLMHGTAVTMSTGAMSAQRVIEVIRRADVTDALLYPFMLYDLLRVPGLTHSQIPSLRRIVSGGDPIMPWAITAIDDLLPGVELVQGYGLTEGGTMSTCLDHGDRWKHPDSVGRPLPLTEVKVAVDTTGTAAPTDKVGEVWVRCPTVSAGYWNKPEATAATFIDGWCRTGDLGRITSDGYLVLTGRAKDMIRSGGENIYPAEIEGVLTAHPAVAEAAVVAVPHPTYLEVGCAIITTVDGMQPDMDELLSHCRERLAGFKCPKHYVVVDELPRNASGKVLKHVLRDRYRKVGEEVSVGSVLEAE